MYNPHSKALARSIPGMSPFEKLPNELVLMIIEELAGVQVQNHHRIEERDTPRRRRSRIWLEVNEKSLLHGHRYWRGRGS